MEGTTGNRMQKNGQRCEKGIEKEAIERGRAAEPKGDGRTALTEMIHLLIGLK
jgi:hypothetical protein